MATARPALFVMLLAAAGSGASAQSPCRGACTPDDFIGGVGQLRQHKTELVAAIREFSEAAAGSYGDEGRLLSPAIDAIERALDSWDAGVNAYESAAKSAPAGADVHAALGLIYLDRSRVQDALREFQAAARLDRRRADVHRFSAGASASTGDTSNAIAELENAAALELPDLATLYRLAAALNAAGRPTAADAQRRFDTVHLATPENLAVQFERVGLVRQVAGVAPIFPPQRYVAAFRQIEAGAYRDAVTLLRRAIVTDPLSSSGPTSPAALAGTRLRQGQLQAAMSGLRAALAAGASDAETQRIAGLAYWADEQYDNSINALAAAMRLAPEDERVRLALADVLVAAGKQTEAERLLSETIQHLPDSGLARYRLAELYRSESLVASAAMQLEAAASCAPLAGLDHLYETLGGLYVMQTDFDHTIAAYEKRIDVNPNSSEAHRKLGEVYVLQGNDASALMEFDVAERLDPDNPVAFAEAAQTYLRTERFADAARAARHSLALDSADTRARFTLGTALVRQGSTAEGRRELEVYQQETDDAAVLRRRTAEMAALRLEVSRAAADGDYAAGVSLLDRAAQLTRGDRALDIERAEMLVRAQRPQDALSVLEAALAGDDAEAHRVAADAYKAIGRSDAREAEETRYRRLIEQRKEERLKTRPLLR